MKQYFSRAGSVSVSALFLVTFAACGNTKSTTNPSAADLAQKESSALSLETESATNDQCAHGGRVNHYYVDANANNVRDTDEPIAHQYVVCNGESGRDGEAGPQGEKGDKGDTGATGATGAQGAQGVAGPAGPQGIQGEKGATGATGAQGLQGVQGETGEKGETGLQGAQGEKGEKGADGNTLIAEEGVPSAEAGKDGDTWINTLTAALYKKVSGVWQFVIGLVGPKGEKGDQGVRGEIGDRGDKGDQGERGDQGAQGLMGMKGEQGNQGSQGAKGDRGEQGSQGVQGLAGLQGPQGVQGPKGDKGETGAQGKEGRQGYTLASSTREAKSTECSNGGQVVEMWIDTNENGTYEVGVDMSFRTLTACHGKSAEAMDYICHVQSDHGKAYQMFAPHSQVAAMVASGDYVGNCRY